MRGLTLIDTGIRTLKLPIGRFNKLEELRLGWSFESFQINELSCLTCLQIFSLTHFAEEIDKSKLVILFDAWRSLEILDLSWCTVLEIPGNISALSLLKTLSLRGCKVKSLPNSIKHLSQLKQIDVGNCKRLRSLPELPPSITHFYVDGCTSLETIDFKLMRAIYNNCSDEVKFSYSGSTIPKGFKYFQTDKNFITIELAPPPSDHLLGFASCCILASSDFSYGSATADRKFYFGDDEINYQDDERHQHVILLGEAHVCDRAGCPAFSKSRAAEMSRQPRRMTTKETLENAVPCFINFLWLALNTSIWLPFHTSLFNTRSVPFYGEAGMVQTYTYKDSFSID